MTTAKTTKYDVTGKAAKSLKAKFHTAFMADDLETWNQLRKELQELRDDIGALTLFHDHMIRRPAEEIGKLEIRKAERVNTVGRKEGYRKEESAEEKEARILASFGL